jgi:hypothetical protein
MDNVQKLNNCVILYCSILTFHSNNIITVILSINIRILVI